MKIKELKKLLHNRNMQLRKEYTAACLDNGRSPHAGAVKRNKLKKDIVCIELIEELADIILTGKGESVIKEDSILGFERLMGAEYGHKTHKEGKQHG